jgi:hypothetical protein
VMGGAWTADDVLEFRCAGADLVGMGLHTLQDPAEVVPSRGASVARRCSLSSSSSRKRGYIPCRRAEYLPFVAGRRSAFHRRASTLPDRMS